MWGFGFAHLIRLETLRSLKKQTLLTENLEREKRELESVEARPPISYVRKLFSQLKETERQILLLQIDDDLTLLEIGAILNLPLGTVKSHQHRAKEKLRQWIALETEKKNE